MRRTPPTARQTAPRLAALARDSRGATAVEYGLIVSLVVLAALGAFTALGTNVNAMLASVQAASTAATNP